MRIMPDKNKVAYLYTEMQHTLTWIADYYYVTPHTVKRWLAEKGISTRGRHDKGTKLDIATVQKYAKRGYSVREIAEIMKVSSTAVQRCITKYNLRKSDQIQEYRRNIRGLS